MSGRCGPQAMFELLVDTSLFTALPDSHDCHIQLSGPPLNFVKPHSPYLLGNDARSKRPADHNQELAGPLAKKPKLTANGLNGIVFQRNRFYHSQPILNSHSTPYLGLSPHHILNRLHKTSPDLDAQVRHLSKYIWPKQYGLDNALTMAQGSGTEYGTRNYDDRELQIKTIGPCKTPQRLRGKPLELAATLLDRHRQCNYVRLLNRHVASRMKDRILSQSEKQDLWVCGGINSIWLPGL